MENSPHFGAVDADDFYGPGQLFEFLQFGFEAFGEHRAGNNGRLLLFTGGSGIQAAKQRSEYEQVFHEISFDQRR